MKKIILTCLCGMLALQVQSQIVNIPDANFKQCLLAIPGLDDNGDGEIQVSEANMWDQPIECSDMNIADVTGLEAFINITELLLFGNQISSIDVSQNVDLTILGLNENFLTSLDVSNNTELAVLAFSDNPITSIDVSNNGLLESLFAEHCDLSTIDTSNNGLLERLRVNDNNLTSLDVSQNPNIWQLWTADNAITNLDVSMLPELENLLCQRMNLTTLDLSNNPAMLVASCSDNDLSTLTLGSQPILRDFYCYGNQLISLDVSGAPSLELLACYNNPPLVSLDLRNGNISSFTEIDASGNSSLECIDVDDPSYAMTNWIGNSDFIFDRPIMFCTDCSTGTDCILGTEDHVFDQIAMYPNPAKDMLTIENNSHIEIIKMVFYDKLGRKVLEDNIRGSSVDISSLNSGIYFVKIATDRGSVTKKLVKE